MLSDVWYFHRFNKKKKKNQKKRKSETKENKIKETKKKTKNNEKRNMEKLVFQKVLTTIRYINMECFMAVEAICIHHTIIK